MHREASGRRHGIDRLLNDQLGIVNAECLPRVVAPGIVPTDIEVEPRKGRCRGGNEEFLQHRLAAGLVREPRHKGFDLADRLLEFVTLVSGTTGVAVALCAPAALAAEMCRDRRHQLPISTR